MLKDKDIREPLFEYLEETYGKVRIIEEKQIGKSRADVMMVTEDRLYGIEIKSDADTYARLERQVKDYNRFFDYNIAAVGSTHGKSIAEHLPEYWGIITIEETDSDQPDFYVYREPLPNPKREKKVKLRNQLSILWRPEMAKLQEELGLYKYPGKSKRFVMDYLMEQIPEEELKKYISQTLMERDYSAIAETIAEYKTKKKKQ